MKISIITSAPSLINNFAENTMLRKAIGENIIDFHIIDVREFADNSYKQIDDIPYGCLLYTSPSPRDRSLSRMPSSA